jgi:hypothetical protein
MWPFLIKYPSIGAAQEQGRDLESRRFWPVYRISDVVLTAWRKMFVEKRGRGGVIYHLMDEDSGSSLSYDSFLNLLEQGGSSLTEVIRQYSSPIFWECIPVDQNTVNTLPFEFVILEARQFSSLQADSTPFTNHFNPNSKVVTFENLGRDAMLVVPCPSDEVDPRWMINLQSFVHHAPDHLIEEFWQQISQAMRRRLRQTMDPIWLSTSGLGVYWLHVRLDTVPKYYHCEPYRQGY